jgi:hypothetical protein
MLENEFEILKFGDIKGAAYSSIYVYVNVYNILDEYGNIMKIISGLVLNLYILF